MVVVVILVGDSIDRYLAEASRIVSNIDLVCSLVDDFRGESA
jgi:hypothetical protein